MKPDNTPENVKKLRLKAGLTQKECSHIYGLNTCSAKGSQNKMTCDGFILVPGVAPVVR
ncbi:YajA protein [Shigella sonnei]|uniref:hypothetical protein n=1 Tax=Shigella sonnei TaxID=624 RepID=UPI000662FF08|nr:YajA protein [Shigella sonnei]